MYVHFCRKLVFIISLFVILSNSCFGAENKDEFDIFKKEKYKYNGTKYRSPFLPPFVSISESKGATEMDLSALNPSGIIVSSDKKYKSVLLVDINGITFIAKDGKIYNNVNRILRDYSTIVKKDKIIIYYKKEGIMKEFKFPWIR